MIITSPVTKAKPEDREAILDIFFENHAENGQFPLSRMKIEDTVDRVLNNNEGIIGIIRQNADIESIIVMKIGQFWYTDDLVLEEVMNYVRPAYRRTPNAKEMIRYAKKCAEELKIPLVIGVTSNVRTQSKIDLYERELGPPWGAYFVHNAQKMPEVQPGPPPLRMPFVMRELLIQWLEEMGPDLSRDLRNDIRRCIRRWSGGRDASPSILSKDLSSDIRTCLRRWREMLPYSVLKKGSD